MDLVIPGRPEGIPVAEPLSARHKDTIIFIANSPEEARRAQAQHPGRTVLSPGPWMNANSLSPWNWHSTGTMPRRKYPFHTTNSKNTGPILKR